MNDQKEKGRKTQLPPQEKPRLSLFHNLPSGGGIRVVSDMLTHLAREFRVTVHFPRGSAPLLLPDGVMSREWDFPPGRRPAGLRRAAAPLVLPARLRAFDSLCADIAAEIDESSDIALVHNSMYIAAPPLLSHISVPSVYYCYEFPRHIYEPSIVRRTENSLLRFMLFRLRWLERRMDRRAVADAGEIVALSSFMAARVRDIYSREPEVVRPGVDTVRYHRTAGERKNMVLSVGALWPFKGHEMAIEAVSAIPKTLRPSLTVVADREFPGYERKLSSAAEQLEVSLRVRRRISDRQLVELYNRTSAVVCCQKNEPYGLVPLEAMACGTAVVAVAEGGFLDNVRHGENGILVERDPPKVGEAIQRVISDTGLQRRLAEGGRRFVTSERTRSAAAEALTQILNRLL